MPTSPTKVPSSPFTPTQSFGPRRIEKKASGNLLQKVVGGLFSLVLVAGGVIFGYTFVLQQKLTSIQSELSAEKLATSQENYMRVREYDRVVRAAQYLLVNRNLHAKLFTELEAVTKQSIFYDSFESILSESGDISLTLSGVSPEVAQVVLEQDAFKNSVIVGSARLNRIEKRTNEAGLDNVGFVLQVTVTKSELVWLEDDGVTSALPLGSATTDSPDIMINDN